MSERSDLELVRASQSGDRLAWELLAHRYAPRLSAYLGARLRRVDVVDRLVADAIYSAWRHLPDYEESITFAAWMRRMAANQALKWHKAHKDESLVAEIPESRCEDDLPKLARLQRLDLALGKLSEPQRMALEQAYRGGLGGAELAEALHLEESEVPKHVEQALRALWEAY